MSSDFDLEISADTQTFVAEFRLRDSGGAQIAYKQTDFAKFSRSKLEALFDLREHLKRLVEAERQPAELAQLGVEIAKDVLGDDIFKPLWEPQSQRTLRILLPQADQTENSLAAALARVPWEVARPAPSEETLLERNLLVRVVHAMAEAKTRPLELGHDEPLRVLIVFAAARASTPLAARRERRALQRLFEREIYPERRVIADFLTHGVTRERLIAQIEENGGYHIVHWSGHGHKNMLELADPNGAQDLMSGEALLGLFASAGGFIPRLFFLSACHSGDISNVKDWAAFLKAARGAEAAAKEAPSGPDDPKLLNGLSGFTGTAYALLAGGVASVVAMRYSVGDAYACDLGVKFYRALLAYPKPQDVAAALTTARNALRKPQPGQSGYDPCDHATPILYGAAKPDIRPPEGRSRKGGEFGKRLHKIGELTVSEHAHFVGRTWQLAGLETQWLGVREGDDTKPVAVVIGLGGMGKTALAAEALDLWERRFRFVLLYQLKPEPLRFENWLRDIDQSLKDRLGDYKNHIDQNPGDAVYVGPRGDYKGERRSEQLIGNLVRALKREPILVVLDNFETHLKPTPEPGVSSEPLYAGMDPVWDAALARLAKELVGSGSRVLITCRRPLAALAGEPSYLVRLGPLPPGEAALDLREHAVLSGMVAAGGAELALARRLLTASRFHPLLMDRLARLASPHYLPQLKQALETLEGQADFSALPDLFAAAAGAGRERELKYLDDALEASIDQLLAGAGADARRLLWIVALANEPVELGLLAGVWSGESVRDQQLRHVKSLLENFSSLSPGQQEFLKQVSPELRAEIDALPPARPELGPFLNQLEAVGLADIERQSAEDENPDISCHELVRERIRVWMIDSTADRGELDDEAVRLAYADRLAQAFEGFQHENMTQALEAGARAMIYIVQAGAYERLGGFASAVVTGATDVRLLERLIPHLESALSLAPEGRPMWTCLGNLADALRISGRPDLSLTHYEKAAGLARAVAEKGDDDAPQAWADLGVIAGNWAIALAGAGKLAAARDKHLDSALAEREAGAPEVRVLGSELEALRIDIMRGEAEAALPQVQEKLAKLQVWWDRSGRGEVVPEAPQKEYLARALLAALDIVTDVHFALEQWAPAVDRIDEMLNIQRDLKRSPEEVAATRFNRTGPLIRLGRFGEAKQELEACLDAFRSDPSKRAAVLSTLADLYDKRGDKGQAIVQERRALALRNTLPDPSARAISHNNLASYLDRSGDAAAIVEAPRHQLAALAYRIDASLGQDLKSSFRNYVIDFRRAHASGAPLVVPRLDEALADPAFDALRQRLQARQVDGVEVQTTIDQFLEKARELAEQLDQGPS